MWRAEHGERAAAWGRPKRLMPSVSGLVCCGLASCMQGRVHLADAGRVMRAPAEQLTGQRVATNSMYVRACKHAQSPATRHPLTHYHSSRLSNTQLMPTQRPALGSYCHTQADLQHLPPPQPQPTLLTSCSSERTRACVRAARGGLVAAASAASECCIAWACCSARPSSEGAGIAVQYQRNTSWNCCAMLMRRPARVPRCWLARWDGQSGGCNSRRALITSASHRLSS